MKRRVSTASGIVIPILGMFSKSYQKIDRNNVERIIIGNPYDSKIEYGFYSSLLFAFDENFDELKENFNLRFRVIKHNIYGTSKEIEDTIQNLINVRVIKYSIGASTDYWLSVPSLKGLESTLDNFSNEEINILKSFYNSFNEKFQR